MSGSRPASCTMPRQAGPHQAVPIHDSWYSERTQHRAVLNQEACHPVITLCKACHVRIRRDKPWLPWEHDRVSEGSGGAPAGTRAVPSEPAP